MLAATLVYFCPVAIIVQSGESKAFSSLYSNLLKLNESQGEQGKNTEPEKQM